MHAKCDRFTAAHGGSPANLMVQADGKIKAIADAANPPVRSKTTPKLQVDRPMTVVAVISDMVATMCTV